MSDPQDDVTSLTVTSHKAMLHPNFQQPMFKLNKLPADVVDFRACKFIYVYVISIIQMNIKYMIEIYDKRVRTQWW